MLLSDLIKTAIENITTIDILIYLIAFGIIYTAYWYLSIPKGIPPGPPGLPFIGFLPFLGKEPYKTFAHLGKNYGNVISIYMGNKLMIILNDYEAIKEAFNRQGDVFAGRPKSTAFNVKPEDTLGISTTDGPFWKDHRRFALTILRDLGIGKTNSELRIREEIQCFLAELRKSKGKRQNVRDILYMSVANNVCIMIFGKRFDYENKLLIRLRYLIEEFQSTLDNFAVRIFFPWLQYFPGINIITQQKRFMKIFKEFHEKLEDIVTEKKKTYVEGSRADYVDAYLTEKNLEKKNTFFEELPLIHNLRSILAAGTDTTTASVMFFMLYMMNYPEVQKKVQKEIDDVIGTERLPAWDDRFRTPYTEATLLEMQRLISLTPLSLARRNMEDTELFGHKIPKGSYILPNLWAVHRDPKLWENPNAFRPERFIDENGVVVKPEYLIPFSTGKRQCLGKTLATMELYLYFATMLQQFTFKSPTDLPPSLQPIPALTFAPGSFEICAVPRKQI